MADKRRKSQEQLNKKLDDDIVDTPGEIEAAGDKAWVKEDQAWSDTLPEGAPLPETLAEDVGKCLDQVLDAILRTMSGRRGSDAL